MLAVELSPGASTTSLQLMNVNAVEATNPVPGAPVHLAMRKPSTVARSMVTQHLQSGLPKKEVLSLSKSRLMMSGSVSRGVSEKTLLALPCPRSRYPPLPGLSHSAALSANSRDPSGACSAHTRRLSKKPVASQQTMKSSAWTTEATSGRHSSRPSMKRIGTRRISLPSRSARPGELATTYSATVLDPYTAMDHANEPSDLPQTAVGCETANSAR
jgi:hypothetical protein